MIGANIYLDHRVVRQPLQHGSNQRGLAQFRPSDHRQGLASRNAPTQVPDEPLATDELVSGGGTGSERWDEHDPLYHSEIRT